MSILDNLRVGRWPANVSRIHWRAERQRARAALRQFGLPSDPMVEVGTISAADKAIVGLIRALEQLGDRGEGLLVLDEPTAVAAAAESGAAVRGVRRVAARGFGVLFVSTGSTRSRSTRRPRVTSSATAGWWARGRSLSRALTTS